MTGAVKRPVIFSIGNDAKTVKGEKVGILTAVSYMAPARMSGVIDVCPHATPLCAAACLGHSAGRVAFTPTILSARIRRAEWFKSDRAGYMAAIVDEIRAGQRKAEREGLTLAVRLNGSSDLPWERFSVTVDGTRYASIMHAFPLVTFYDYTKWPRRLRGDRRSGQLPENYSLTFSLAETIGSAVEAERWIESGENVAVVFALRQKSGNRPADPMPETFTIGETTVPVIDGDENDVRFFDELGRIVGLRAKGSAKSQTVGGFVKDPTEPVYVTPMDLAIAA